MMKQKLQTQIHTIYLLIGPSGCGKSTFSKECLIPQLQGVSIPEDSSLSKIFNKFGYEKKYNIQKPKRNVAYISSDEIRQELLGYDYDKYSDEMLFSSEQAFKILYKKLESVTTYPVNAEFVVIDTTGLSETFRKDIIKIGRENCYNTEAIVFEYKNKDEFTKYLDNNYDRSVVFRQLRRFNKETLKELNRKDFRAIHKIKSKDFSNIEFEITNLKEYEETYLPDGSNYEYVVVSDPHGCYPEFKALLEKNDFVIQKDCCGVERILDTSKKNRKIIIVGDINDKGKYTKELIHFIYNNLDWFKLVAGNHENFVYKYLKGKLKKDILPQEFIEEQFGSIFELQDDEDTKEMFFNLVEESKPFYRSKYFIVTHAPCKRKYLGKFDRESVKAQRSIQYPKSSDYETREEFIKGFEERLSFLKEEAQGNQPFHIFGHTSFQRVLRIKNKLGIDTNCVKGGRLTSVVINGLLKPFFVDVPNQEIKKLPKDEQVILFSRTEKNINYFDLSDRERFRITKLGENKVNFISGTMCPADKDQDKGILESMANALSYYRNKGVRKVILQPKYMGSRCNVYLFQDIEKCYATSRNGYSVNRNLDLTPVYQSLLDRHLASMQENNIKLKIIDMELMPWFALGKGLIESEYNVVDQGIFSENEILMNTDFEKNLNDVQFKMARTDFLKDHGSHGEIHKKPKHPLISLALKVLSRTPFYSGRKALSKQELVDKYSHTVYSTFKNYLSFSKTHIPLEKQVELHKVYREQLEIFGADSELSAKPFAVLKDVYADGTEELYFDATNEDVFKQVSDDEYIVIDLSDENALEIAEAFYNRLTVGLKMEGVVVKPNDAVFLEGIAPYRKVRNKNYLTIIYGYDYLTENKYEKLLRQKRIDRKLSLSIKEFELGKKMLEIPYDTIEPKNKDYENLIMQMIAEEKKEVGLDPRL